MQPNSRNPCHVRGRTHPYVMAKIISVGLIGLTQLMLWFLLTGVIAAGILIVFTPDISFGFLTNPILRRALVWSILFFIGGYIFYGSMFAAVGAT